MSHLAHTVAVRASGVDMFFGTPENQVVALKQADFEARRGELIMLVGPSGCGKTTLLRHMAAFDLPRFPRHLRVLHVRQEVTEATQGLRVIDAVLGADAELATLAAREKSLTEALEASVEASPDAAAIHAENLGDMDLARTAIQRLVNQTQLSRNLRAFALTQLALFKATV